MEDSLDRLEARMAAFPEQWREAAAEREATLAALEDRLAALDMTREQAASEADSALGQLRARAEHAEQLVAGLRSQLAERQAGDADTDALRAEIAGLQERLAESNRDLLAARDALAWQETSAAPRADDAPFGAAPDPMLGDVSAFGPKGHKKRIGEILVDAGLLTEEQVDEVLLAQESSPHHRFGALVVERGFTTEQYIAAILAAQLRLPYADLEQEQPEPEALRLVSAHLARHHHCIPLRREDQILHLAMENPLDLIAIEDIELASGLRAAPVVAVASQIQAAIRQHYG